jgi:hypothetical protein
MWNVSLFACRRIASPSRHNLRPVLSALLTVACSLTAAAQAALPSTTTTLTLSSSSVASPAEVILTAKVAGIPALSPGTVTFCNASAPLCEDTAILGKVQLVAGTATLRIIPAIGSHTYKAIFNGTTAAVASTSTTQTLTVTGLYPTTTAIAATGNPSGYGLTATVVGFASQPPVLAGSVTFQDTTDNNLQLGVVPLGTPIFAQSYNPAPGSPVQTGNSPSIAGVGDFNEDGIPDLAIENAGDNTISILLGKGDGTFTAAAPVPAGGTPPCQSTTAQSNCAIVVGDFNNDGHVDLAVTSRVDATVTVLLGNGKGQFTEAAGSPITVGANTQALKIGDFNNDGNLDLVVANGDDDSLSILLGVGDGTFTQPNPPISLGPAGGQLTSFPFFIAVADFNSDNNADLAVVMGRTNNVILLEGNGDGTFTPFASSPITLPEEKGFCPIVAADFNGDGKVDLAVAFFGQPYSATGPVYILLGDGHGTFTPVSQAPVGGGPFAMVALDYNGDGITDLAVANSSVGANPPNGSVTILKGKGDGTFSTFATIPVGLIPNDVVSADFNGDGHPDLAVPNSYAPVPYDPQTPGTTTILLNTVTQTATAALPNVVLAGAGTHVVMATYPANTEFNTSSATIDLDGFGVSTALTLSANPAEQMITMPVTLTAQLSPTGSVAPTGSVTFYDQSVGTTLGTAPVSAAGQAVLTISSMGPGVHSITASYGGDTSYPASNSNAVSVKIDELRVLRVGNNNTTILPGTTVVYTLQVQPQVATAFLYSVSFTTSGLPAGATATFSPATLAPGGGTTNITMTVNTATTASNTPPPSPFERMPIALGLLLPLFGAKAVRRRLRQIPPFLGVALLAALSLTAVAGLSGCSGAGLFAARKVSYPITVIATEGTVQRTTEVPLAIQ